jgi:hypothetical protein
MENHHFFMGKSTINGNFQKLCCKHTKNYRKSQFLMGKSTISMSIFNSKLLVYQRVASLELQKPTSKAGNFGWLESLWIRIGPTI